LGHEGFGLSFFFSKSQMAFHLRDKGSQIGFHERKVGELGFKEEKKQYFFQSML